MRPREVPSSRPLKASGALIKMPFEGVALSHARPAPSPAGFSFRIIRMPQTTRAARAFKRVDRPITANIKTWIIAWEGRDARRTP